MAYPYFFVKSMIDILLASLHQTFSESSEKKNFSDSQTQTVQQKKILIIAPAWIGDMVMAHSLFQLLKANTNNILHVAAPKSTLALLQHMNEIGKVFEIPCKHDEFSLKKRYQFGKNLRQEHYDQAIVLPNTFKSALIPFFAHIPLRTGWKGEQRYLLLNDLRKLDPKKYPLMVRRFAALAFEKENFSFTYPKPALSVDPIAVKNCCEKFHLDLIRPVLALCPGAAYGPAKRWPPHYFAEIAEQKIKQGYQVWILGGPDDKPAADEIMRHVSGCLFFAGTTSLNEAVALLSLAAVIITNDSGLMHIAAALQKPLVAIFGSSSPKFTPPLSDHAKIVSIDLPCRPCFQRTCPLKHLRCLNDLKPEMVLNALNELMGKN